MLYYISHKTWGILNDSNDADWSLTGNLFITESG